MNPNKQDRARTLGVLLFGVVVALVVTLLHQEVTLKAEKVPEHLQTAATIAVRDADWEGPPNDLPVARCELRSRMSDTEERRMDLVYPDGAPECEVREDSIDADTVTGALGIAALVVVVLIGVVRKSKDKWTGPVATIIGAVAFMGLGVLIGVHLIAPGVNVEGRLIWHGVIATLVIMLSFLACIGGVKIEKKEDD